MIDRYDFGAVAGSIQLDGRISPVFTGGLSGNLSLSFPNISEGSAVLVQLTPNGFAVSFSSVTFPSGTSFPTAADSFVRITKIGGFLYGEVILP